MIGVISSLLVEYLDLKHGAQVVDQLRAQMPADHDHRYRIDAYYDESAWQEVYAKAIELVGQDRETFEWDFGIYSGIRLVGEYPTFVQGCTGARDMLLRQPKIHNAIGQSLMDSTVRRAVDMKFNLEPLPDKVIMHYRSPNKMCTYYRSLATWVGDHFGEDTEIHEPRCLKRGDSECEIHVRFTPKGAPAT